MFLFNKNYKGFILIFLSLVLLLFGCKNNKTYENEFKSQEKNEINIVTTIFPIYDITKSLTKDMKNVNITMLLDNGIDLHNYSPTSNDLIKLSKSDLFIYIGGESDEWVYDAFKSLNIDDSKKINLIENLKSDIKVEELIEGMEEEKEERKDSEEEEVEYDEHIWLSIRNAEKILKIINDRLIEITSTNDKGILQNNYNTYLKALDELDSKFAKLVDTAKADKKVTTLLLADRFPFRYFVDDYALDYFAAFKGCSAEPEASFKTIKFLADKIDELNLKNIFVIEDNDQKIAKTVIGTATKKGVGILVLDSMQNKTINDVNNGINYIDIMNKNYEVLDIYFNN